MEQYINIEDLTLNFHAYYTCVSSGGQSCCLFEYIYIYIYLCGAIAEEMYKQTEENWKSKHVLHKVTEIKSGEAIFSSKNINDPRPHAIEDE